MTVTQFPDETPFEALVNHYSLDVEEEAAFLAFVLTEGLDPATTTLMLLDEYYLDFCREYEAGL